MEEVWKDITLASLNPNPNAHFQALNFQDFLSQPFSNRNPSLNPNHAAAAASSGGCYPSPPSPPPIALSLNSGPDPFRRNNPFMSNIVTPHCYNNVMSFDELAPATEFLDLGRKRFPESDNSGERRHKRMIKNRESAARSRARRQAYTAELELEVTHLTQENARLKRQQLCLAAASQVPKKKTPHRASTAPF